MTPADTTQITIRRLRDADRAAVERIANLDSSPIPTEPALGAEVDGRLVAAVSLDDGSTVADPFRRTIEVLELLRGRVRQLRPSRPRRRSRAALAGSPPGAGGRLLQLR